MSDELIPAVEGSSMKAAAPPPPSSAHGGASDATKPAKKAPAKRASAKKAPAKKTAAKAEAGPAAGSEAGAEAKPKPAKKAGSKPKKAAATPAITTPGTDKADKAEGSGEEKPAKKTQPKKAAAAPSVLFQAPEKVVHPPRKKPVPPIADTTDQPAPQDEGDKPRAQTNNRPVKKAASRRPAATSNAALDAGAEATGNNESPDGSEGDDTEEDEGADGAAKRRPRRRGGRRRRKPAGAGVDSDGEDTDNTDNTDDAGDAEDDAEAEGEADGDDEDGGEGGDGASRRRRTRNRVPKSPEDEIASVNGSTRLEAKKQRRREGREAGRRRAPIVSEAEFLTRREAVDRVMVIRQRDALTQIGVLEDNVLVEHYVSRESQASMIGNVYLGRVQNVLPSMEAAFIDIGQGRNAVLYAGEVNWAGVGHKDGQPRKVESVLTSGQKVLVQVTKDPVGQKGARLTGQISIPGRFLVYVPDGTTSGISRKLPDTERNRLKALLKEIVPNTAGVIVRTAAEGASEEELTHDVERLTARWSDIEAKVAAGKAPEMLYGEPDLTLKVVRDLFTEDFSKLVIQGDEAWELVQQYVQQVAPDLADRLERFGSDAATDGDGPRAAQDLFAAYRIDEQIAKGLERKAWLPSGGSLVIDRTEAMTVVDVNTGKFTGSGGNLEETVTKNNLEAAEEIVRQLRLRDIGGIIVIDFIDMVLESNRDLVLRRLVECLGRDRTRHQVAEVTSLGLVQMTRKRIGTGLVEAFSEECPHCKGRGLTVHQEPIATAGASAVSDDEPRGNRRRAQRRGRGEGGEQNQPSQQNQRADATPSPANLAGPRPPSEPLPMLNQTPEALGGEPSVVTVEPSVVTVEPSVFSAEPVAEPVQVPVGPTVVTSTRRRRTATRPAGPPTSATSEATPASEKAALEPTDAMPVADILAGSEVPVQAAEPSEFPEPSKFVESDGGAESDGEPDGETVDENGQSVLHVPVKKRGARKR